MLELTKGKETKVTLLMGSLVGSTAKCSLDLVCSMPCPICVRGDSAFRGRHSRAATEGHVGDSPCFLSGGRDRVASKEEKANSQPW